MIRYVFPALLMTSFLVPWRHVESHMVSVASSPRRQRVPRLDESIMQGLPGSKPAMRRDDILTCAQKPT